MYTLATQERDALPVLSQLDDGENEILYASLDKIHLVRCTAFSLLSDQ
jgi:hypothetical protein